MSTKRVFLLLVSALLVLAIGLVGSAYGINSLLKTKSAQLATNRAQVSVLSTQQNGIAKSKRDITKYSPLESVTKAIVPQDKDQAEAVREITNIAAANNVSLTSITFPASTLGAGAVATTKPTLSQLIPVKNIPGVYDLQITITNSAATTVTFNQLDAFLHGLENNRRTAAVSSLSIQPQSGNSNKLVFSLIINDYIKPTS